MGLLDDAIREHLELKRRHGADPGEVARQEREVLGAPRSPAAAQTDEGAEAPPEPAPAQPEGREGPPAPAFEAGAPRLEPERAGPPAPPPEPEAIPEPEDVVPAPRPAPQSDLDWSEPSSGAASEHDVVPADEEEGEDVLEETPDFLQETPEHDRLWFEQRPPRDFDF
jgi:hypothetical protein